MLPTCPLAALHVAGAIGPESLAERHIVYALMECLTLGMLGHDRPLTFAKKPALSSVANPSLIRLSTHAIASRFVLKVPIPPGNWIFHWPCLLDHLGSSFQHCPIVFTVHLLSPDLRSP